ncbi:hypothetical protein [Polaromonas sp.]|uniref:hypothetical protein n=1 Tax=Polaromonas sp. TaxID=1869339 RepID=UPI00286A7057|nr:hypothetical protein [Polaromonas sp.]
MTDLQKLVAAAIIVAVVLALIKLLRVFNSPDGERYLRLRTQGPFVPHDATPDQGRQADTPAKP